MDKWPRTKEDEAVSRSRLCRRLELLLNRDDLLRRIRACMSALERTPAATTRAKLLSQLTCYCAAWQGFVCHRCGELFDIGARQPGWRLVTDHLDRFATACPSHAHWPVDALDSSVALPLAPDSVCEDSLPKLHHVASLIGHAKEMGDGFVMDRIKVQFVNRNGNVERAFAWAEEDLYLRASGGAEQLLTMSEAEEHDAIAEVERRRDFSEFGADGDEIRLVLQSGVTHRSRVPTRSLSALQ